MYHARRGLNIGRGDPPVFPGIHLPRDVEILCTRVCNTCVIFRFHHNLADQLLRGISIIFSEEKASESDIKQIWDYYPDLFEDEKKEYYIQKEQDEFESFKARRLRFANSYNKKFKGDD